ncbi:MAG TPA: ASCH domain-containing protein [Alphaproteobacteria bacterium]
MIIDMRLQPKPFERIKSGLKKIELRIHDEKRRALKVGDGIVFRKRPDEVEELSVRITDLLVYPSFSDLLGYADEDRDWAKESLGTYYTPEEEKEWGVVGICIELNN